MVIPSLSCDSEIINKSKYSDSVIKRWVNIDERTNNSIRSLFSINRVIPQKYQILYIHPKIQL